MTGAGTLFSALVSWATFRQCRRNLGRLGRLAPLPPGKAIGKLSVCVPARNEERALAACLDSVLASRNLELELLVYDDESTDGTASIIVDRGQSVSTEPLPPGWTGKQHACHRMSQVATGDWLCFLDADVTVHPDALARAVAEAERKQLDLLSAVPEQRLGSLGEALFVPTIFFLLWSYLPLGLLRERSDLPISAGCGQFLLVRAEAYRACGGHAAFPGNTHDGLYLPRNLRKAGYKIDLADVTGLIFCRMYHGLRETWNGFGRNAYEALGSPLALIGITALHLLGHLGAWVAAFRGHPLGFVGVALQLAQRWQLAGRCGLPRWTVLLHPFSLVVFTAVQWWSFTLSLLGRRRWKGRTVRP